MTNPKNSESEQTDNIKDEMPIAEEETCVEQETENLSEEAAPAQVEDAEEDLNTKHLRLMADFQNFRRRTEKEKQDIYAYANEKLVSELLNVADNFERALEVSDEERNGFVSGMEMIFKQLMDVLKKAGLEEIDALGKDFDPNLHHAVMTACSDEFESGKVSEVFQKGYMLNKKVIRPSMVKVSE